MSGDLRPTCATCIWFDRGRPTLATGIQLPDGTDPEHGTCNHYPPELVQSRFFVDSLRPATNAVRVACCFYDSGGGPDDGAREDLPEDNVIQLGERAAA